MQENQSRTSAYRSESSPRSGRYPPQKRRHVSGTPHRSLQSEEWSRTHWTHEAPAPAWWTGGSAPPRPLPSPRPSQTSLQQRRKSHLFHKDEKGDASLRCAPVRRLLHDLRGKEVLAITYLTTMSRPVLKSLVWNFPHEIILQADLWCPVHVPPPRMPPRSHHD